MLSRASSEDKDAIPADVDLSDPFFSQDFGPEFENGKQKLIKAKNKLKKKGKYRAEENTEEEKKQKVYISPFKNMIKSVILPWPREDILEVSEENFSDDQ